MRFMVIVKANRDSEAAVLPDELRGRDHHIRPRAETNRG